MGRPQERIPVIDALRGLAALVIILWHFRFFFGIPFASVLQPFYEGGWIAVDLFFVLSGFILTRIYCLDRVPEGYLRHFATRRFARIYPLHLLSLAVVCLLLFVAFELTGQFILYPGYAHNDLWNFVLNVFLLQQSGLQTGYSFNAPSWSISTEMIANCFLAVIIFYVRADRRRTVCAVALAVAVVVKLFLFGYPFVEKMFLQTALGFLSGILLAFGLADIEARGAARPLDTRSSFLFTLPWRVPTGWASDALFAVCAGLMVIWMLFASSLEQIDPVDRSSHAALDVVVMPTMVAAAIRSRLVSYLSATAVGRWLGAISYSTYLWHFPVAAAFYIIIFLGGLARAATVGQLFFVYVATVLIVADLSYRWFEWPARRWIIRRLDSRPPTIDGQGQVLDATRAAPPRLG